MMKVTHELVAGQLQLSLKAENPSDANVLHEIMPLIRKISASSVWFVTSRPEAKPNYPADTPSEEFPLLVISVM